MVSTFVAVALSWRPHGEPRPARSGCGDLARRSGNCARRARPSWPLPGRGSGNVSSNQDDPQSSTAMPRLNRWARHRPVRTKYATVAGQRLEPFAAALAIIEELAGVRRHLLGRLMAALGARDGALGPH